MVDIVQSSSGCATSVGVIVAGAVGVAVGTGVLVAVGAGVQAPEGENPWGAQGTDG